MDYEIEIERQQAILAELNRMRVRLENLGTPPNDKVFNEIVQRGWIAVFHWEVAAFEDPANRFYYYDFG